LGLDYICITIKTKLQSANLHTNHFSSLPPAFVFTK
jgi:hypothetical protein